MGVPHDDDDERCLHVQFQTAFMRHFHFSSRLSHVNTPPQTSSIGGRLWVPYKDPSLRGDWSNVVLIATEDFTNQMAKKGQSQLSIQKNGCSLRERLWAGRPAQQLAMDSPHPTSLEVSPWPLLDNQSVVWVVVSIHPDTQRQRAAEMASCGGFGARKPPGTCPVIYFWLFFWFSFSQPVQMTCRKVQTMNLAKHQKLILLEKIRGVTQKWRRFL